MGNIWRVFTRDAMRLITVPQTWIIIIGVTVLPCLYAWVNVLAFWDPYAHTSRISVAVVNLDDGATSELTGPIDAGDQIVAKLSENDQLGWEFMDQEQARQRVNSGESYAAIIIPATFSSDLLSITSGTFTQPTITYLVNEKANAVATKITDVGAGQLDEQITSTFTSVVAETAAQALQQAGEDAKEQLIDAQGQAIASLDEATAKVAAADTDIAALQADLAEARTSLTAASTTLADVDVALGAAQAAIATSQTLLTQAMDDVNGFITTATSAYLDATTAMAATSAQAQQAVGALNQAVQEAGGQVSAALDALTAVVQANGQAIGQLQDLIDAGGLDPAVASQLQAVLDDLAQRNAQHQELLTDLGQLGTDSAGVVASLDAAASQLDSAVQDAATAAGEANTTLLQTIPQLSADITTLSASASAFSAALGAQRTQVGEAQSLLAALDQQMQGTSDALGGLAGTLTDVNSALTTIRTDVATLGSASMWDDLGVLTGLDAEQIGRFMASPVQVSTHVVFPIASYGSAMAALFTNLSLWIGAFMLMVLFRLEVDSDGVAGLTVRQAYLGRWLLLACVSVVQGLLVTTGNLVIGVETANAAAFVATGVVIALAYLSIVYALSISFTHIGKGLCVVLVIMQIPGSSGLYPIEMMPAFFRSLYPYFPFTYGIDAMRETISGFYGNHYWQRIGMLAVFVAASFALGLVVRRRLGNLTRMFNRRIAETDLLLAEEVSHGGGYRLSQILRSLAGRAGYRRRLEQEATTFARHYPRLRRGAVIVGIAAPVVLLAVPSDDPSTKALLLGIWVAVYLLLFAYLITLEYVRDAISDGLAVSAMSEPALRKAIAKARDSWRWAGGGDGDRVDDAADHPANARDQGSASDPGGRDAAAADESPAPSVAAEQRRAPRASTVPREPDDAEPAREPDDAETAREPDDAETAQEQQSVPEPEAPAEGGDGR